MTAALQRVRAITLNDFRIRIRQSSTAVIFLLLCIAAYMWIPDPSTGRALLQMNEQRALYNSPALALATASLCAILLGLIGYYLVSNSIGRDTRRRTGFVIASTTVRNYEYLFGIFLGNVVFLIVVVLGFMASCIVMQLIRGEAPIQIASFLWHYFILLPPMIIFVSAVALLFETVRWLSGRFGDLVYFFVWMFVFALVAVSSEKGAKPWTGYVDTFSFAFMLEQVKQITHSDALSIGSSNYDVTKPPFLFPGLGLESKWIVPRLVSTFYPLTFVFAALVFFNRFNPVKVKASHLGGRLNLFARVNSLIRPLTVPLFKLAQISTKPPFLNAIISDALLTLQLHPLTVFACIGLAVASLFSGIVDMRQSVLPIAFVAAAMILADLVIREKRAGTTSMIESLPLLKPSFVWWKLGTALVLIAAFVFIPLVRLSMHSMSSALSLVIGSVFLVSCAIALGIASGNPKTFMVAFFLFLYVVMNDSGKTPAFDFAGWFGSATPTVQLIYSLISIVMMAFAFAMHRLQQKMR